MQFLIVTILGFAGTEIFSYLVHRFVFHGVLWKIHITHHKPRRFFLELNDIFSLVFALISIALIISGNSNALAAGLGIAFYGLAYFITHDLFTHRRFLPFKSENRVLQMIRTAHQRHHQSIDKKGIQPFGLFVFDYRKFTGAQKSERDKTSRSLFPLKEN